MTQPEREMKPALKRGAMCRCPQCGEGRLYTRYLKVAPSCSACGLDFTHQRADDGPAYIVVLLVGHLVGVALHPLYMWVGDNPMLMVAILCPIVIVLCLALLPVVKGAIIAFQWAKGMHGFGAPPVPAG